MLSPLITSVTSEIRSRSPSSNLVFAMPWCFCVPELVRIHQTFLQVLSQNHLLYAVTLNDLCDLKIRSRSPGSNLVFVLPWCFWVPILVRIYQIFLQIMSGNHLSYAVAFNDLCDLGNKVKVTRFKLGLCHALLLLCTRIGEETSHISSDIERKPSFTCCRFEMTRVTSKIRSRSPISNMVFILPWCFCVPNLVRIRQVFSRYLAEAILHMPARKT